MGFSDIYQIENFEHCATLFPFFQECTDVLATGHDRNVQHKCKVPDERNLHFLPILL